MELMEKLQELAKTRTVNRTVNKDKQSFGDFVEGAIITQFLRHWEVEPISLGRPSPFDFKTLRDGKECAAVEVKAINNDFNLPYFLYEVEDRGMVPCHFGAMIDTKRTPTSKEYFIAVDCNIKNEGHLHIYPAKSLAEWCTHQPHRQTEVDTNCVNVPWDVPLNGSRQLKLDNDVWDCIKRYKEEKHKDDNRKMQEAYAKIKSTR